MIKQIYHDIIFNFYFKDRLNEFIDFYSGFGYYYSDENFIRKFNIDIKYMHTIRTYLHNHGYLNKYDSFKMGNTFRYELYDYLCNYVDVKNKDLNILEIGPGFRPCFNPMEYRNWNAIDGSYDIDKIDYEHLNWNIWYEYIYGQIKKCNWEELSIDTFGGKKFDLIFSSHVYEHVFTPIKCLDVLVPLLNENGKIIIIVPNGFSCNAHYACPYHTMYITPSMIQEFVDHCDGLEIIDLESIDPDHEILIVIKKIDANIK